MMEENLMGRKDKISTPSAAREINPSAAAVSCSLGLYPPGEGISGGCP